MRLEFDIMKIDSKKQESDLLEVLYFVLEQIIGLVWLSYMTKASMWNLFKVTCVVAFATDLRALHIAGVVYFLQQVCGKEMGLGNSTVTA